MTAHVYTPLHPGRWLVTGVIFSTAAFVGGWWLASGGWGSGPAATATAPVVTVPAVPLTTGTARQTVGNVDVRLALPTPVRAMRELPFAVDVRAGSRPVDAAAVSVVLTMDGMYMGDNQFVLKHQGSGRYLGKGIIPVCSSGKSEWLATVRIDTGGRRLEAPFRLTVER